MITTRPFGLGATLFTLDNGNGMQADITDFGATIVALRVPSKNGTTDAALGYESAEGYRDGGNYLGATVSRYGNRLGGAQFTLDGKTYHVPKNDGENCLHGGSDYHVRLWQAEIRGESLVLTMHSPDGDFGFPGAMTMQVVFLLDAQNGLHIDYTATADRTTLCNLTNHVYFNFTENREDVLAHELFINADTYTATDAELIPTADVPVADTAFDFRTARPIADTIYDNNFNLRGGDGAQATLYEKTTGVFMEVFTDRPGIQVYASGMLPEQKGKHGARHGLGAGLALETQVPPNAPNRKECDALRDLYTVEPERPWKSTTIYRFSVK
ncbi:MAG: galactose mutarotase [Oscillospiraceae bacterium]|nr:galactose mutarotase [Oscillospiraceae bacterium]